EAWSVANEPKRRSVMSWAISAWRDAFAAVSAMPRVLGVASAAILALHIAGDPLMGRGYEFVYFLVGLGQAFLLTPVAIAVHRFVMIGEIETAYRLRPREARFQRFFVNAVIFQLIMSMPVWVGWVLRTAAVPSVWLAALFGPLMW